MRIAVVDQFRLTTGGNGIKVLPVVSVLMDLIGKTVKFRRGPAAVTEDESHKLPLFQTETGRSGWRMIRKPEDLLNIKPEHLFAD